MNYGIISGFKPKNDKSSELGKDFFTCEKVDPGCKIIFKDLNTDNPQMSSVESGNIMIMEKSKTSNALLFAEMTSSGTLNLFRIELGTGLIVETKNCVSPIAKGSNYGAIYVGQCR